jgi:protein-tyrosine phosphatase
MKRVLCVCLGNICRSPLAEGVLKAKAQEMNLPLRVASAGTLGFHVGSGADKRSVAIGKKYNVDISNHQVQKFSLEHFDLYDIILVMDRMNFRDVASLARNESDLKKISLYLEDEEVSDPYTGPDEGFETLYNILEGHAEHWVRRALQ